RPSKMREQHPMVRRGGVSLAGVHLRGPLNKGLTRSGVRRHGTKAAAFLPSFENNAAVAEAVLAKQACRELASARKIYPWLSPPLSSRTMEPTKFLASPNSIRVLSR